MGGCRCLAEQWATGTVIIHQPVSAVNGVALYARDSSADQKADLDRPLARRTEFAIAQKFSMIDAVKEVGSGLNGVRQGMRR